MTGGVRVESAALLGVAAAVAAVARQIGELRARYETQIDPLIAETFNTGGEDAKAVRGWLGPTSGNRADLLAACYDNADAIAKQVGDLAARHVANDERAGDALRRPAAEVPGLPGPRSGVEPGGPEPLRTPAARVSRGV